MSYSNRYIREQSIKDAVYRAELDKCDADEKELRATRDLLTASRCGQIHDAFWRGVETLIGLSVVLTADANQNEHKMGLALMDMKRCIERLEANESKLAMLQKRKVQLAGLIKNHGCVWLDNDIALGRHMEDLMLECEVHIKDERVYFIGKLNEILGHVYKPI